MHAIKELNIQFYFMWINLNSSHVAAKLNILCLLQSRVFFAKSSLLSEATEIGGKKASNSDMHVYRRHASYLSEKSWTYPQINIFQTVLILVYVISEIEYPKHKHIYLQAIWIFESIN